MEADAALAQCAKDRGGTLNTHCRAAISEEGLFYG